ncbi:SDR family NAD(P)-dependent oxidoreductase [Streptomyces shenzhenensis]|uniref:SDR family NAD(P)-dependent oxidoreductase n=1 Tax=Streptomyces shenzhenensis TaxID=943815 RepID=UPI0015F06890|nr:SDR family oxidoreductase [Streptomyces shenzhenensis]
MSSSDGGRSQRFLSKVCLVTGGSRGLGLAAAQAFAREGARVIIVARDPEQLSAASAQIKGDVIPISGDLASVAGIKQVVAEISAHVDQIDVAYLNAGRAGIKRLEAMDEETWDRVFDTNVKGPFFLVQSIKPMLVPGSTIVFCGSAAAKNATAGLAAYGSSKAALEHLTRILAAELVAEDIRVNIVVPGGMNTDIALHTDGLDPQSSQAFRERIRLGTPMLREGEPDELADAVLFLASSEASYITGAQLAVDGGATGFRRPPS